jgi:hypothetical protein
MVATSYQIPSRRVQKSSGKAPVEVAPRPQPKPDSRARIMLRFFLDQGKADECDLIQEVATLKKERQFAPTIRDGLRLMRDLRAGRFDALFDLFDWIPAWIDTEVERRINERMQDTNNRLARLEAQIALLGAPQPPIGQGAISQPGPKPMNIPSIPGPVDDDDDVIVPIKKAKSDGKSAQNFLDAAFGLIQ